MVCTPATGTAGLVDGTAPSGAADEAGAGVLPGFGDTVSGVRRRRTGRFGSSGSIDRTGTLAVSGVGAGMEDVDGEGDGVASGGVVCGGDDAFVSPRRMIGLSLPLPLLLAGVGELAATGLVVAGGEAACHFPSARH